MNRLINFFFITMTILCLSFELQAAHVPPADAQQQESGGYFKNIQIIKDIKAFIRQNPNLRLVRLNKQAPENVQTQSVKYSLGNRVPGDRLVAQLADTFFYPALKDVSHQVVYPETGTGSIVTSVDIYCLQNNADGNAYVVDGGIGHRFISIVLEATQTTRFTYNIHVYGKKD